MSAIFGELFSRIRKMHPLLTIDHYKHLVHGNAVDGRKTATETGLSYTEFETGMEKTLAWYWQNGYLNRKPDFLSEFESLALNDAT